MTNNTVSAHARTAQHILNNANDLLSTTLELARDIGLAPFRIRHIIAAMDDNTHAWQELNELATALELTGEPRHPTPPKAPIPTEG